MSKRKADQLGAESTSVGGGAQNRAGDAKEVAPVASGWSGLPSELVRRVGQLQDDPRSLAGMERTCKSWRKVIVEGNDGADMGDTPCLWRELALAKFPRLRPLVEAVRARSKTDPKRSWKALYRANADAHRLSCERTHTDWYRPKTSWDDYFLTVEFRDGKNLLFVASGKGDRTSPLWDQEVDYDDDGAIVCKGALDPRLSSRLGSDPFDWKYLRNITARVLITRLSDLSIVELGEMIFSEDEDAGENDGNFLWGGRDIDLDDDLLPIGISSACDSIKPVHVCCWGMRMKLWFTPSDGTALICLKERDQDGDWDEIDSTKELAYLELHCPWPKTELI